MAEESQSSDRKPQVPSIKKPSAQEVVNKYLTEQGISLALDFPAPERTPNGMLIINAPKIVAVYVKEQES